MRRCLVLPVVLLLGAVLAACGGGSSSKTAATVPPANSGPTTTIHIAEPAGDKPSESAVMICTEAVPDVNETLGVKAKVSTPTWKDHVYACDYTYKGGAVMKMSVKELSSYDEVAAYFKMLAQKLGKTDDLAISEGAFQTTNGSVVVRKDFKVLTVDISKLPAKFGDPIDTRGNDAINTAFTVMNCWTGA